MFDLKSFFGKKPGSDKIADMKRELEKALQECRTKLADMEAKSGAIFLDGSPKEIEDHRAETRRLADDIALLEIQIGGVDKRLHDALGAEEKARVDKIFADAKAASERGMSLLEEYFKKALPLAEIAKELSAIELQIVRANEIRVKSKRSDEKIISPDRKFRPQAYEGNFWGVPYTVAGSLVLPGMTRNEPLYDGRKLL